MSGKALPLLLLVSGFLRGEIKNLSDGIYTQAQAEDGAELYTTCCAHCHPSEFYADIQITWSVMSVLDFYYKISGSMLADKPRASSQSQYLKLLAWLLAINGFPSGNNPILLTNEL